MFWPVRESQERFDISHIFGCSTLYSITIIVYSLSRAVIHIMK